MNSVINMVYGLYIVNAEKIIIGVFILSIKDHAIISTDIWSAVKDTYFSKCE